MGTLALLTLACPSLALAAPPESTLEEELGPSLTGPLVERWFDLSLPLGFRLSASLTTMPYVWGNDEYSGKYFSAETLSVLAGWGI